MTLLLPAKTFSILTLPKSSSSLTILTFLKFLYSAVIKGNVFHVVYQVYVFVFTLFLSVFFVFFILSFDHFVYFVSMIVDACLVLCLCLLRFWESQPQETVTQQETQVEENVTKGTHVVCSVFFSLFCTHMFQGSIWYLIKQFRNLFNGFLI